MPGQQRVRFWNRTGGSRGALTSSLTIGRAYILGGLIPLAFIILMTSAPRT